MSQNGIFFCRFFFPGYPNDYRGSPIRLSENDLFLFPFRFFNSLGLDHYNLNGIIDYLAGKR